MGGLKDIDLKFVFNLPPKEAVRFFEDKGMQLTWSWWEMWQEDHTKAFTVAKVASLDILQDIRDEVEKAIRGGITFREFERELTPILQERGWWGKVFSAHPEEGIRPVWLGTPWRLKTIFNTNVQSAYMAGRYRQMMEITDTFPYWQYLTADDERVRQEHARYHKMVIPYDHPFWQYYYPPNGWGCRCRVRALTDSQLQRKGLEVSDPEIKMREWINRATGEVIDVPEGIDPGFAYNPGQTDWTPERNYDPVIQKLGQDIL